MKKRLTTEEFISKAIKKHGYRYDYEKTEYVRTNQKVIIICKEHGDFLQTPNKHLYGRGCPICGGSKQLTIGEWLLKVKKVHGDTYDYSKTRYVNAKTPVTIICEIHGEFIQVPDKHKSGHGCPICRIQKHKEYGQKLADKAGKVFIQKAKAIHGEKFDYSKVEYSRSGKVVTIICKEHGEFYQTPDSHFAGSVCPKCIGRNRTLAEWIQLCQTKHHNYYSYEAVALVRMSDKVVISCPKHGKFIQKANDHMIGKGCPICGAKIPSTDEWIERARAVHGDKYSYIKTIYKNRTSLVTIICNKHGEFTQRSGHHLEGRGCSSCACSGYDQSKPGFFYIQLLDDKYIKFGITNKDPTIRMKNQEVKSHFEHRLKYAYKFNDGSHALRIESSIKQTFKIHCGLVDREQMPDGFTETLPISKLTRLRIKVLSGIVSLIKQEGEIFLTPYEY